ncbi:translation initiation factor IF-6 [Methanofollis aquaemaris]|uniref:Translation initiation factor 6 n=1 Tax=Methanofollis aquaemaris TaxID=126734 RepID=A0A8A3S3L3_9EURY|nr:translation initiation factor IF-6 [Methanofollis aquaemaris]QSZ66738.1 translation initiation factor IF-6 [Methanofollis aquaemaris]
MERTIDFAADPHIGVFARAFEEFAVVPPTATEEFVERVAGALDVEVVRTTVQGSSIIGSLLAGNSNGMVVSGLATEEELAVLGEYGEIMTLGTSMNAAGNVILANDSFAAVHPEMSKEVAEEIGTFLGVPVRRLTFAGVRTVGMAAVATNKGVLVHARSTEAEIADLAGCAEGLVIGTGTVNMGSGLVGTGVLANSKGYIAGFETTGFELGRIEEVFGFLE